MKQSMNLLSTLLVLLALSACGSGGENAGADGAPEGENPAANCAVKADEVCDDDAAADEVVVV